MANNTTPCNGPICENTYDANGKLIGGPSIVALPTGSADCQTTSANGCPPSTNLSCSPFQLTKSNDKCFIDSVVAEALNIGAANVHVFKLLGVHEQGKLNDLTGNGIAISGGALAAFPATNAFDTFVTEWRSLQKGTNVLSFAFIGYDFGEIKLDNSRVRYGVETFIKHNIATIKIKQSSNPANRVLQARIERSADGINWYGVSVISLPNDDCLNTIYFKHTVPSRWWRIRPISFTGGPNDFWGVQALQLMDYDATSLYNIEDEIFLENRDRDYATESVTLKMSYSLIDTQSFLTRFAIELPSQIYQMLVNFSVCVQQLGRPIVIGDIFEVPSETQYSSTMQPIKKYLEVTDVTWSTQGYTPGWMPTMLQVTAAPMMASQETQDIVGSLAASADVLGLLNIDDGNSLNFQDLSIPSQTIQAAETTNVPERGAEIGDITWFTPEQLAAAAAQGGPSLSKLNANLQGIYAESGMPPNGLPYTEGDAYPTSPKDGDYHRLTYTGLAADIPPRLFKYSIVKGRWIYLETDRRAQYRTTKPILQEFLSSSTKKPANEV